MGTGKFFFPNSQYKKSLQDEQGIERSTDLAGGQSTIKNNVVSIVEHKFKRMNETHDRIRTALFASYSKGAR